MPLEDKKNLPDPKTRQMEHHPLNGYFTFTRLNSLVDNPCDTRSR